MLGLVILALLLRLWGLTWGLPDQQKFFSYHPDEGVNLVNGVMDNGVPRPHLDLGFYNYGGLYFYLWQAVVAANRTYGLVKRPPTGGETPAPDSPAAMILLGRLLTALLGALTVWAVFALGNRLFGYRAGLAAGTVYAIMPAAVVHGHFATVDVPATFFVTVALVFGARLLAGEHRASGVGRSEEMNGEKTRIPSSPPPFLPSLLAGFFSGLAAATKYNAGLVLLAPLTALYLRRKRAGTGARAEPWIVLGMAVVGFLVGCPGALVNWEKFSADFAFELRKSGEGMGLLFADTGSGWLYHLTSSLRFGLGLPLLLLALAALGFALVRRTRQDGYLLAFALPYYLVIGYAQVRFLRYVIPLLPVLAVLMGRLLTEPWPARPWAARALAAVGAAAGLHALLLVVALDRMMTRPDARDQAHQWLLANVPPGRVVAFATTPWYYTPPLAPEFTAPSPSVRRQPAQTRYTLRLPAANTEWDRQVLAPPLPDVVLLSDLESQDAIRLNLPAARQFLGTLRANYTAREFQNRPSLFGLDFGKPAYVPNDWLYIYPRITLYTKR